MKILFRADDLGFSEAVNYGIVKSIVKGPIRNVGLMPNMEAAQQGFQLVKDLNICLGQHSNISVGVPLSDPKLIPSLINEQGEFYTSKEIHVREKDTIDIKECEIELEAQLKRFIEITGKKPEYFEGHAVFSQNFFIALENVAKRNKLFYSNPLDPKWADRYNMTMGHRAKIENGGIYDPYRHIIEDEAQILTTTKKYGLYVFHPGYIDQYLWTKSSFNLVRPLEVEFLTSSILKDWMKKNTVELYTFNQIEKPK